MQIFSLTKWYNKVAEYCFKNKPHLKNCKKMLIVNEHNTFIYPLLCILRCDFEMQFWKQIIKFENPLPKMYLNTIEKSLKSKPK